jgi:outer membrane protein OmpA-like peptidoglycan-associated protein
MEITASIRKLLFSIFFCTALAAAPFWVYCEDFQYIHRAGDKYRIISIVKEDVYVDKTLSHRAEILNRIAVEVTGVRNGRGSHKAVFQTSERSAVVLPGVSSLNSFEWAREYESVFDRDRLGYLSIDPKYFMPVVRNVPVFPGKDLKAGERWHADGHEMHDFRDSFGIEKPYRIPFSANYVFLGERQWKGVSYPAFSVSYRIITGPQPVKGIVYPRRITGSSDQIVYWDSEKGQPTAYEETFRMMFELSNGRTIEFTGTAEAEIVESEIMDKDKLVSEIAEVIDKLGINDTNVRAVDEGITISLEDVKFLADAAVLLPEEKAKLNKIAELLKLYPDRDIMVSGHTALAGSAEGRMKLSLDRAKAVTDYLLSLGVRTADRAVVRGFGAEKPVADNRTEEGMRRNRRVEITILEN